MKDKTQSQRIRNVIYLLWEKGGAKGSFDEYYKSMTDNIIKLLKERLDK